MKSLMIFAIAAIVATACAAPQPKHTDDFRTFWNLHQIEHYLEHLNEDHDMVNLRVIGTSGENRPIYAVKVGLPHDGPIPAHHKRIIMVESGLHAREWVAPMVNLYLIHMLVEHYPEYSRFLEHVDFVFVPIANPDGYEYSHQFDRNWNKNRRFIGRNCYGIDINRNFDFQFLPGSNPCDDDYAGISAGSEPETQAIQNLLDHYNERIAMYVSLQAHGQQILTPYNYAPIVGDNHEEHMQLCKEVADQIESFYGTHYTYGPGGQLLDNPERGTSSDYAHGHQHVPLAFTIKLPGGGDNGFDVPESDLDHILTETWFGFLKFVEHANLEEWSPY